MQIPEHALEHLLAFDGRLHYFASGHFLKFEARQVDKSEQVPHGIAYPLTLHAPGGNRILGFDNAHTVPHPGGRHVRRRLQADHWHRSAGDQGRPYDFVSVERLLLDFFGESERVLKSQGVDYEIVLERQKKG